MAEAYFTEDQKMFTSKFKRWNFEEQMIIQDTLYNKGYLVNCVTRIGCDRKSHDAWQVYRADVPRLIEQLFRQRFSVEVQAEGKGMASINFVYDYAAESVISAINRFHKNNNKETRV